MYNSLFFWPAIAKLIHFSPSDFHSFCLFSDYFEIASLFVLESVLEKLYNFAFPIVHSHFTLFASLRACKVGKIPIFLQLQFSLKFSVFLVEINVSHKSKSPSRKWTLCSRHSIRSIFYNACIYDGKSTLRTRGYDHE